MFEGVKWLFFDVGSTLLNEEMAYRHRLEELAKAAGKPFAEIERLALGFYRQNQKGDLETAKLLGLPVPPWHSEDESLYGDAEECLQKLSQKYKIGVIANQPPGTGERLAAHGILQYMDLVVASAEEGVAKPDKRIFEIALERGGCGPNEAVMIGDRVDNDIVPANLLGFSTIWVKQGFGRYWQVSRDIEKADAAVDSLKGLLAVLCAESLERRA